RAVLAFRPVYWQWPARYLRKICAALFFAFARPAGCLCYLLFCRSGINWACSCSHTSSVKERHFSVAECNSRNLPGCAQLFFHLLSYSHAAQQFFAKLCGHTDTEYRHPGGFYAYGYPALQG